MTIFLGDASEFLMFNEETGMLEIIPGSPTPPPRSYPLIITLKDDNPQGVRTSQIQFKFEVTDVIQSDAIPLIKAYN